jgi:hypothetical protein
MEALNMSDKVALYRSQYPRGTVLELTAPIADDFSPKPQGARFQVEYVDDQLQLHERGSLAIIPGVDSFKIVRQK